MDEETEKWKHSAVYLRQLKVLLWYFVSLSEWIIGIDLGFISSCPQVTLKCSESLKAGNHQYWMKQKESKHNKAYLWQLKVFCGTLCPYIYN